MRRPISRRLNQGFVDAVLAALFPALRAPAAGGPAAADAADIPIRFCRPCPPYTCDRVDGSRRCSLQGRRACRRRVTAGRVELFSVRAPAGLARAARRFHAVVSNILLGYHMAAPGRFWSRSHGSAGRARRPCHWT